MSVTPGSRRIYIADMSLSFVMTNIAKYIAITIPEPNGTVVSVLRAKNIAWNAWPVPGRWSQYRITVVMGVIVVM